MELTFNSKKLWEIPKPSGDRAARPSYDRVTQVKFYNEYYPTGHKIFNPTWYNDILIKDENGNTLLGYPDDNELYLSINSAEYGIGQSIRYLHQLQNIYFDLIGKELKI